MFVTLLFPVGGLDGPPQEIDLGTRGDRRDGAQADLGDRPRDRTAGRIVAVARLVAVGVNDVLHQPVGIVIRNDRPCPAQHILPGDQGQGLRDLADMQSAVQVAKRRGPAAGIARIGGRVGVDRLRGNGVNRDPAARERGVLIIGLEGHGRRVLAAFVVRVLDVALHRAGRGIGRRVIVDPFQQAVAVVHAHVHASRPACREGQGRRRRTGLASRARPSEPGGPVDRRHKRCPSSRYRHGFIRASPIRDSRNFDR